MSEQAVSFVKNHYYIYLFCANYTKLRHAYGNLLNIQLENIKALFINTFGEDWISTNEDPRSLIIVQKEDNESNFSKYYNFCQRLTAINDFLQDTCRDHEIKIEMHAAIITGADTKGNPFKRCTEMTSQEDPLPFVLLSEKAAISIIESYNVYTTGVDNIWLTDGVIVSEIDRLFNIYLDRVESEEIDKFFTEASEPLMVIYGGLGTGKSRIMNDFLKQYEGERTILYAIEEKHNEREFSSVVKLLEQLLFKLIDQQNQSINDLFDLIENSQLCEYSKKNLLTLTKAYFAETEEDLTNIDYEMILTRLKFAIQDAARLYYEKYEKPLAVIIDNRQYISSNCEAVILTLLNTLNSIPVKMIFIDREENIPFGYPVKELIIGDLDQELTKRYLKLCFPHKIISKNLVKVIHEITGGNIFCLKEYLHYLLTDNAIIKTDKHLKIGEINFDDLPGNLQELFLKKIDKLDSNSLNLLKIMTVFGDNVKFSDLDTLLHSINYPGDDNIALNTLEKSGLLSKDGTLYHQTEDEVSRHLYNSIIKENRVVLHNLIAEMYEKKGIETHAFKIFYHYYRAENHDKLLSLLPEIVSSAHQELKFNALRNILNLSETLISTKVKNGQNELLELWIEILNNRHNLNDKYIVKNNAKVIEQILTLEYFNEHQDESLDFMLKLCDFHIKEKNFPKALELVEKGLELATTTSNLEFQAEFNVRNGSLALSQNQYDKANECLTNAKNIFTSANIDVNQRAIYLKTCGWLNLKKKNYTEALAADRELLNLAIVDNHLSRIYHLTENVAYLALFTKEYEYAEKCYHRLLKLSINFGEIDRYNDLTLKLAIVYSYQNKLREATSIINTLLSFPDIKENKEFLLKIYTKTGLIYQYFNEEVQAQKCFTQLNIIALETKNDVQIFYSFYRLGMLSMYNRDFIKAQEHFAAAKKSTDREYYQQLIDLCIKVNGLGLNTFNQDTMQKLLNELQSQHETLDREIIFEFYLCIINIMYHKKYNHKIKELLPLALSLQPYIADYNKIAALKNITREIGKSSFRSKVNVSQEHKVHPSIQKVVKRRSTRSFK